MLKMLSDKIIQNRARFGGCPNELFVYGQCPICREVGIERFEIGIDRNTTENLIEYQQNNVLIHFSDISNQDKINSSLCRCSAIGTKRNLIQLVFCSEIGRGEIDRHSYLDLELRSIQMFEYLRSVGFNLGNLDFGQQDAAVIKAKPTPHYIVFDTETTGLPKNYNSPISDSSNWPRLVHLCWVEYDVEHNKNSEKDYIVKPIGFSIPDSASKIHKISQAHAMENGVDLMILLRGFIERVGLASVIVGHNLDFDLKIIGAELHRLNLSNPFSSKRKICTMNASVNYCRIKNAYGYKYPTLQELHQKLFNKPFGNAHTANNDAIATANCFLELRKKQIIH